MSNPNGSEGAEGSFGSGAPGPWGCYNGGPSAMPPWMMMGPWMQCPPGATGPQMMMMAPPPGMAMPQGKGQMPGCQWPGYFYGPMMMSQWQQQQQMQGGGGGGQAPFIPQMQQKQQPGSNGVPGYGFYDMNGQWQQFDASGNWVGFYDANGDWHKCGPGTATQKEHSPSFKVQGKQAPDTPMRKMPESPRKQPDPVRKTQQAQQKAQYQPQVPVRKLPETNPEPERKLPEPTKKVAPEPQHRPPPPEPIRKVPPEPQPRKVPESPRNLPETQHRPPPEPIRKVSPEPERKLPESIRKAPPEPQPRKVPESPRNLPETQHRPVPEPTKKVAPEPQPRKTPEPPRSAPETQHRPIPEPTKKVSPEPQHRPPPEPIRKVSPELERKLPESIRKAPPEPQPRKVPEPPKSIPETQHRPIPEPTKKASPEPQHRPPPEPTRKVAPEPQPRKAPEPPRSAPEPQHRPQPEPIRKVAPEPQPRKAPEPPKSVPSPNTRQDSQRSVPQLKQVHQQPKSEPSTFTMPPERPLQRKPPDSPSTKAKPLQGCPIVTTKSSVSMPYSILQNARDERSPREEAHSPRNVALQRDFASVPAIDKSTDFVPKKRPLDGSSIPSPKTSPSTGPSSHSPPFVAAQKPQFTVRAARSTIFCPSGSTLTNGFSSPRGSGAKATGFNMSATLRPTSFTEMTREESIESLKAFSTNDFHGGAAHRKTRPKSYFLGYSRRSVIIGGGGTQGGLNASQGRNSNGDMVFYVKTYECVNLRDLRRSAWGGRPRDTMLYSKARGTRCDIFLSDDPDNDIKAHETTSAELELVLAMSDSKTCFIIKFDEPIGVEFPSEEKAESFRNDLASKLKRIEEIDKMKGPTKFFEIYEKTLQPPLTVLQDPKVAKSTPQDAEQAEATTAKFAVLPPVATFGSNGNEIEVGYNLHQDIRVVNGGSKALSFTLELPQFCNRFIASANTFEATVPSGSTCTIRVRLIPLCTTVISDAIKLSITPGRGKQVDTNVHIDVRVKESCFIDDDTLEFDTLVGEGSFGTVAKGTRNGDVVAIKSLRNVDDKQVREDFLRELALLDSLRSPHVMELYGVDINPGNISIVLEYFSLGSLENVMRDYGLTLRMKYRMLKDIAEGMQFLHAMGVVHRDIKPDNILVSDLSYNATITCKIADLGSARTIFNKLEIKQTNGLGTPLYMAPEIISSASTYAKTADVYSFAILAAEVLNEKKPYSECAFPSSWALVNHVMSGKRPVILNEDLIHTCVLDLISECWEKDPNLRPCK